MKSSCGGFLTPKIIFVISSLLYIGLLCIACVALFEWSNVFDPIKPVIDTIDKKYIIMINMCVLIPLFIAGYISMYCGHMN